MKNKIVTHYLGGVLSSGRIINMCLGGAYSNIEVEEEVRTGFTVKHTIVVENETAKKLKLGQKIKLYMEIKDSEGD